MEVRQIDSRHEWEDYILSRPEANFLQSFAWGEFQQKIGKKAFYLGLFQEQKLQAAALVIKETAKRGNYLTIAGGPLVDWTENQAQEQLSTLFEYIKQLAQQEKCSFIRFRPQVIESQAAVDLVTKLGAQVSPMHLTADLTLQLELDFSEDELLAQMRKNTRYEVRKAKKLGIEVRQSSNPEDIKEFYDHQLALAQRHGFVPFGYDFLHEQFKVFAQEDNVVLISSYLEGKLLATAFILFYNKEAVYHYGISTSDNQRLPGSYATQWAAILEAKKRGCNTYNFWGIAPKDQKEHRFAGVSLFKRGFGGQEVQYLRAYDLPVSGSYQITRGFEQLRKKIRKL